MKNTVFRPTNKLVHFVFVPKIDIISRTRNLFLFPRVCSVYLCASNKKCVRKRHIKFNRENETHRNALRQCGCAGVRKCQYFCDLLTLVESEITISNADYHFCSLDQLRFLESIASNWLYQCGVQIELLSRVREQSSTTHHNTLI
jgi:hypothetical protein